MTKIKSYKNYIAYIKKQTLKAKATNSVIITAVQDKKSKKYYS